MNHLPKYYYFNKPVQHFGNVYRRLPIDNIITKMSRHKKMFPEFYIEYDNMRVWNNIHRMEKFGKKAKEWLNVIYDEIIKEIWAGNIIHFPYIGKCYAGSFDADGLKVFNTAFEFYEDSKIRFKTHYMWKSSMKMRLELMLKGSAGLVRFDNVLPIGKLKYFNHEDNLKKRWIEEEEQLERELMFNDENDEQ